MPDPAPNPIGRRRGAYAAFFLLTVMLGLASRRYSDSLPQVIAEYAGDLLWATMMYWLVALVVPRAGWKQLGAVALGISFAVECSQLYQGEWIERVRSTRVGALILGQGFLWSDLLCYAAGVALAVAIDHLVLRRQLRRSIA